MKVRLARKADASRRLGDARALDQEVPGPFHATADDILVRRRSRRRPKLANEVVRAAADKVGKPPHGQIRIEIVLDMLFYLNELFVRESCARLSRSSPRIIPEQMNGEGRAERVGKQIAANPDSLRLVGEFLNHVLDEWVAGDRRRAQAPPLRPIWPATRVRYPVESRTVTASNGVPCSSGSRHTRARRSHARGQAGDRTFLADTPLGTAQAREQQRHLMKSVQVRIHAASHPRKIQRPPDRQALDEEVISGPHLHELHGFVPF